MRFQGTRKVFNNVLIVGLVLLAVSTCQADQYSNGAFHAVRDCIIQAGGNPSDIVLSSENGGDDNMKYNELNYQWNAYHQVKRPVGYFTVRRVSDVQAAVICANSQGVRIVAKGGGHSYEEYGFGNSSSIVIDTQHMHEMYVSPDRTFLTIGSGALLGQLFYPLLEQYNLTTPHGTCPTVGVTGLATGGGYGYLGKLYGLTTDNVIEMELVDATGTVRVVNKQTNSDLLWALKGAGSGSFGIITKISLKTYPAPQLITTGTLVYPLSEFVPVFQAWQQFCSDTYGSGVTNTKLAMKNASVTVEVFDIQVDNADRDAAIRRVNDHLDKFPPAAERRVSADSYLDFIFRTSHPADMGITEPSQLQNVTRQMFRRRAFSARSYFVSRLLEFQEVMTLKWIIDELGRGIDDVTIEMYAFGGIIDSTTDSSFNHRGHLYLVQAFYNGPPETAPYYPSINWLTRYYSTTKDVFRHTESYQNYCDGELGNEYLQRYYGSNVDRLIQIKRTVDPGNVFNHPQSIPI